MGLTKWFQLQVYSFEEYICTRLSPKYLAAKLNKHFNLVAMSNYLSKRIQKIIRV